MELFGFLGFACLVFMLVVLIDIFVNPNRNAPKEELAQPRFLLTQRGQKVYLSDAIYRITESTDPVPGYQTGCLVRLISGVAGSETPGYSEDHCTFTVCSVNAQTAEFHSVKRGNLVLEKACDRSAI